MEIYHDLSMVDGLKSIDSFWVPEGPKVLDRRVAAADAHPEHLLPLLARVAALAGPRGAQRSEPGVPAE